MRQKKRIVYFCLVFFLLLENEAFAQFDYLNLYAGTSFFSKDEKINGNTGYAENLFGGFSQGIKLGAGVEKYFTDNVGISINLDYQFTSKTGYTFNQLKLDLALKYSFFRYSRFSPYVFAGGNLAFLSITQAYSEHTYSPPADYSKTDNSGVLYTDVLVRYPETSVSFAPVFGATAGAGLTVRVNEWFSVFGEYRFDYYLTAKSTLLKSTFIYNTSNLYNSSIQAGVKIDLY